MVKKLTKDGFFDDSKVRIGGEDFEVGDFDVPQKKVNVLRENPNKMPEDVRKEAVKRWNKDPVVKDNDLVCVERNKLRLYIFAIIGVLILGGVAVYLFNANLSDFVKKDFTNNYVAGNTDINNTYDFELSPTINNDHTILNEINVTLEIPDFAGGNTSDVVNDISNKVIEGIRPLLVEIVANVTNQTV